MSAGRVITEDECGLLCGVLAAPDDATARIVYADWLDDHDDPRGPWLRAVCEGRAEDDLRAPIDPNWAALFDRGAHFTVLMTADFVNHFRRTIPAGHSLSQLQSWSTIQSDFRMARVKPGDHVYPIQLVAGRVHVLTRFRVAALRDRTEPFGEGDFLPEVVWVSFDYTQPSHIRILDVADGGRLDYDRVLPPPVIDRLRFKTRRGERGLSPVSFKDGRLTNVTTIHGVFRLAPGSARDFATLVFAPELLDGLAPSPPGTKRK
jgi:uncharacterized protein (TIGR02996 family)